MLYADLVSLKEVGMKVRLSQKGRVVIPASLRHKYGFKPGDTLQVVDDVRLSTLRRYADAVGASLQIRLARARGQRS
jgi:AbrB family looped-hinge helix DNA binding protein